MMAESIIMQKSIAFSLKILVLTSELQSQRQYALANQLFRSGTSIGSNVEEASAGVSRDDFRAKMGIAAKEARETRYWLRLMKESGIYHIDIFDELNDAEELVRILTSIMKTLDEQRTRDRQKNIQNAGIIREEEMVYICEQALTEEELIENSERNYLQAKTTQNLKLKTQNSIDAPTGDGGA